MREGIIERNTKETQVRVRLDLDGKGESSIDTGIGFLDHMLTLFAFHSGTDLEIRVKGDLYVDGHHTVEDTGIALGQALRQALGDKKGICRYGDCFLPMDESLAHCSLDISGRPYLVFRCELPAERVGTFETELAEEFFRAVAVQAGLTLHLNLEYGKNTHHIIEALFKGFGRAMKQAKAIDRENPDRAASTKGVLE